MSRYAARRSDVYFLATLICMVNGSKAGWFFLVALLLQQIAEWREGR